MDPYFKDNIVAVATPNGSGALAIIRISGKNLKSTYKKLTGTNPKNRYALFSKIYNLKTKKVIDEGVVTYFKGPNSYTGEDVIEISCHGSEIIKNKIIDSAISSKIRMANPGEFSFRAFINGKMDLLQAEGVASLISAKGSLSSQISLNLIGGKISNFLIKLRAEVIEIISIIENELNFLEDEINYTNEADFLLKINNINKTISSIINSTLIGKNIFNGIRIVLYGKTNSGKSTLFNSILGHNRSIISEKPGTTRDSVDFWAEIKGVPVCFIDTAGIFFDGNSLDDLGIQKTFEEIHNADICLFIDQNCPSSLFKASIQEVQKKHHILIHSKSDLLSKESMKNKNHLYVSAHKNHGIETLLTNIESLIVNNYSLKTDKSILINARQKELLIASSNYLNDAAGQIKNKIGMDIVASTLRGFTSSISEIIGDVPNREIFNNIFKNFCVGK